MYLAIQSELDLNTHTFALLGGAPLANARVNPGGPIVSEANKGTTAFRALLGFVGGPIILWYLAIQSELDLNVNIPPVFDWWSGSVQCVVGECSHS